jgi:hypothetical protein
MRFLLGLLESDAEKMRRAALRHEVVPDEHGKTEADYVRTAGSYELDRTTRRIDVSRSLNS